MPDGLYIFCGCCVVRTLFLLLLYNPRFNLGHNGFVLSAPVSTSLAQVMAWGTADAHQHIDPHAWAWVWQIGVWWALGIGLTIVVVRVCDAARNKNKAL
jgi:hypothetical protein